MSKFEEIWTNHNQSLLKLIKSKVSDQAILADILQEISIKLHQAIDKKMDVRNYKNWLNQVTRNTIADYYRASYRQEELKTVDWNSDHQTEGCVCDLSGFLIKNYLPKAYGEPLYLSDIEQLPQSEIADKLKLSLSATKSRIQRARSKLKKFVLDYADISYNPNGQVTSVELKKGSELPVELKAEIEKLKISL